MSILTGANVSKSFGAFDVFIDLNFSVARGDKIALVGPNGCGKTTLLTLIAGVQEPNIGGEIHVARGVSRGYLAQTAEESNENTVWQEAQTAFADLHAIQARMAAIELEMSQTDAPSSFLKTYGALQHEFELKGGYTMDTQIKRVLSGLGFKPGEEHKPLSQLSGGQRVRAALAKLLLQSPDILLLDEPTNHLDRQGVEWLEGFLQEWEGTLIVVSHDRYFLDEVCDRVWEIGRRADGQSYLDSYRGGYTDYAAQRAARRERALAEFEAQREFIAREEEYIRRNIAGQNTLQAKGRLKRLNRMERLEKPIEQRAMSLRLKGGPRSGNIVLETSALAVGYRIENEELRIEKGEFLNSQFFILNLFECPDLILLRTERAALVGPNGTGKTTFLKTIMGEIEPLAGEVKIGANVKMGYFAQAHEGLNLDNTVLQELMSAREDLKLSEARDILGRFLFSGDDQFKKVEMLSGGERGRVALARLTLQGANFLLLDEPTNHLDIPSQEILTEALNHFDGTLLLVSHDRYLIAALATQIWSLERDEAGQTRMTVFRGTYDAWVEEKREVESRKSEVGSRKAEEQSTNACANPSTGSGQALPTSNFQSYPSPAPSKNAVQQRLRKLEAAEQRIQILEKKLTELSWQMETAGSDYAKAQTLGEEYRKAEQELIDAWAEFEKLA
jgi:ATP-binding cassette subfamily F protein 3